MEEELIEKARRLAGDEEADRLERLINELDEVEQNLQEEVEEIDELRNELVEGTDLTDEAVNGMSLDALEEVAEEFGLRDRANVKINVAGNPDQVPDESPDVIVNRSTPETFEREVPLEAGDDADTMTVEYEADSSYDDYLNWRRGFQEQIIRDNERAEQRANEQTEEKTIPTGVVNLDDVEIDEENDDIPVAGNPNVEDEE